MALLSSTRLVPVPAQVAAAVVLDWSRDPSWRSRVTRMEVAPPGPARVGQEIVEHLQFGGRVHVTPSRITQAGPDAAEYAGGSGSVTVSGSRRIEDLGPEKCRVTTVLDIRMNGLMRPLTALLAPPYRRIQERDLDRLVDLLVSTMQRGSS